MKHTSIFLGLTFWIIGNAFSQNEMIGYQLSQSSWSGSPRAMGVGDAFGALGADIASSQINPAGLAQFRKSEFSFSLNYLGQKNTSKYLNTSKNDNSSNLSLSNGSIVLSSQKRRNSSWKNFNLGLSYNQNNRLNRRIRYEGINNRSSYTEAVALLANQIGIATGDSIYGPKEGFDEFADMFWFGYLIDPHPNGGYLGTTDSNFRNIEQRNSINQRGKNSQFNASFSGNYNNQILFGAGINFFFSDFNESNLFTELNDFELRNQNTWDLYDFSRSYAYSATGIGLNLGLIALPSDHIRIGLAFQTPKYLTINETFSDDLSVQFFSSSRNALRFFTKEFTNSYRLVTPSKTTFSFAYLFGKMGFLSADVETIDYPSMQFSNDELNLDPVNDFLQGNFRSVVNFRVGGEYVLGKLQLRGGYGRLQSPNKEAKSFSEGTENYTVGIGLKDKKMSIELAYLYQIVTDAYSPYSTDTHTPVARNRTFNRNLILGAKFRF